MKQKPLSNPLFGAKKPNSGFWTDCRRIRQTKRSLNATGGDNRGKNFMEQIDQLKTMRDEALERLETNPDFKLLTSLDALIVELEAVLAPADTASANLQTVADLEAAIAKEAATEEADPDMGGIEESIAENVNEAFEKISAEMKEETASTFN